MQKISKTVVIPGVWVLDIPGAQLSILCGCPPDVVKHLLKAGLISSEVTNGIAHETGPNAILLSDLPMQNEQLTNMAEFPVLQMLYRQGMLIPGHPKNTGIKPLIMGSADQVGAQMTYIYRGNYGLVSEAEMVAAGITKEDAQELMAIKLQYAFGTIQASHSFLDAVHVTATRTEIRNGAGIRRLGMNIFEVDYEGQAVTVNLSLNEAEQYQPALRLGSHPLPSASFSVIHSGEGDGWDTERGPMSSVLMVDSQIYLVDAGPNILQTLKALGIGPNELCGIFHTHSHDDHFAGLPDLIRGDQRLRHYAAPLVRAAVTKKLCALLNTDEDELNHFFEFIDLRLNEWNTVGGLAVRPTLSPHPVETTVFEFRVQGPDGPKTYAHLADISAFELVDRFIEQQHQSGLPSTGYASLARAAFSRPATVKKIDIGGGRIHGQAADFSADRSEKILLAHTARALTTDEARIGSQALFGSADILIPGLQEPALETAFTYLSHDFPGQTPAQIQGLLKARSMTIPPGEILMKAGEKTDFVYLVIQGYVEKVTAETGAVQMICAGRLMGASAGFTGLASPETYRAASYTTLLEIPGARYLQYCRNHSMRDGHPHLNPDWRFISESWLFGTGLIDASIDLVFSHTKLLQRAAGECIHGGQTEGIYILKKGSAAISSGPRLLQTLGPGATFGEQTVIRNARKDLDVTMIEASELYLIDSDIPRGLPVCHWKLLELSRRRDVLLQ